MDLVTRVLQALEARPPKPDDFERFACAMLQDQYPGLSAIEQGQDFGRGADIFFPFGPEDPRRVGRLTVTIGDPVVNLRRGLRQMRRPRPWPSCGSAGGWPISTSPFRLVGEIKNAG